MKLGSTIIPGGSEQGALIIADAQLNRLAESAVDAQVLQQIVDALSQ